jgi:hypothetical protein
MFNGRILAEAGDCGEIMMMEGEERYESTRWVL